MNSIRIEHLAVWTAALEPMKDFYVGYFGARAGARYTNASTGFSSYFLTFSSGARLELMNAPGLAAGSRGGLRAGLAHFAVALGGRKAVTALTEKMRRAGITVVSEPRVTGDGYFESVVLDPDGNRLELTG